MQIHFGIESLRPEWRSCVACIGAFDGVHLGHQEVIRTAVKAAREKGLPAVLVTFHQNPAAILAPDKCPPSIASLAGNLREFERNGLDLALILRFDRELSEMSADAFYEQVLHQTLRAAAYVIGHDFTFGKNRGGNAEWLAERAETTIVPPFQIEGTRVSSSAIRRLLQSGEIAAANALLGHPFEIEGVVVAGQKLGRELGFPTANLARSFNQVTPADGVYAGRCITPYGEFAAAVSIGVRPTIDSLSTVEAYLLDYPGESLYGHSIRVLLTERLREQRKFDSLQELRNQIASDVAAVSHVN